MIVLRLPTGFEGVGRVIAHPVASSLLRYGVVLTLCLAAAGASGTFLTQSAVERLGAAGPAATEQARLPVSVPDTPVIANPAQLAVAAAPAAMPLPEPESSIMDVPTPSAESTGAVISTDTLETAATADAELIAALAEPIPPARMATIRRGVNLRSAPRGDKLAVLPAGEQVQIVGQEGNWYQVAQNSVVLGWVYGSFIGGADEAVGGGDEVAAVQSAPPKRSRSRAVVTESEPVPQEMPFEELAPLEAPDSVAGLTSN